MKGTLIIISSPSGGGKGTLIKEIQARVPNIGYSVSYTTRAMRDGEADGRDYHFVSREEFLRRIDAGEFLEYAEVHGNFYGTSQTQVARETELGRDVILEIDVQGAALVLERFPEAVSIFILPPSYVVLSERLASRGTESEETLELRLRNSRREVEEFGLFQYAVINDNLVDATRDLETIILAERLKSIRQTERVQDILDSFDASKINTAGD
ncbi:MAG: guanylate kinase [Acidobacteria bacterium]|nr:guanylate kinase [Acidobacteriota bacterium]